MGKITKTMQDKHKELLTPWVQSFVDAACTKPLPVLPDHLAEFPTRWPMGRGDLYHWIPLLNRFDAVLERFCSIYELDKGPQPRDFGSELLENHSGDAELSGQEDWRQNLPQGFQIHPEGDRLLVEAILNFTNMLLEHCGNRSIYASSSHLSNLLNTTSWTVLMAALQVSSELAQRYQASVKRLGNGASRHLSSALLTNHYNIDLERVQFLASPFTKTPIVGLGDVPTSTSASASKSKDKGQSGSNKGASVQYANDLVGLAFSDKERWLGWGDIRVTYYPEEQLNERDTKPDAGRASLPTTPTPLRRSHTVNTQSQTTPRTRHASGEESSPLGPRTPGPQESATANGPKVFELPQVIVQSSSAKDIMARCPSNMPSNIKYEVFNRWRVAKALLGSTEDRRYALASRLLAILNLAYIHNESNLVEKVLRQDIDETRRFQLVYQLAELIRPSSDGLVDVPIWIQTIALTLLEAISMFTGKFNDVLSALNANVNHGVLMYVIRKAVAGMEQDDEAENRGKVTQLDEWRDSLFSLTLYLSMQPRAGPEIVSAGLMDVLVDMLKLRSNVARRYHCMVVGFLDGIIWVYQNAFTAFFNVGGLDAIADVVVSTVSDALELMNRGLGTTPDQQSVAVDYKIPYYQQQTLRWLFKFIHHIMSNSYTYGGNTDRLLRNLADKAELLDSLKTVMANKSSFGTVDWTTSVTILSDFINNDPTSFGVIMDSGMIHTFLEAITGRPVSTEVPAQQPGEDQEEGNDTENPAADAIIAEIDDDQRPHPPSEEDIRQMERSSPADGVLVSSEAMNVVPSVLNSICLNNDGMKLVVKVRAFGRFLEVFESTGHIVCMENDPELSHNLGSSFDELARHHPALRTPIANAVVDMVARVRYFGIEKAESAGWGAKLLVTDQNGAEVSVSPDGSFQPAPERAKDQDVDMSEGTQTQKSEANPDYKVETAHESFTPFILQMSLFLSTYIHNNTMKRKFVEMRGLELLLDIAESPSLSAVHNDSFASRQLGQVIAILVQSSPVRGLPSLLNRAQAALDLLEPLATKKEPVPPYFAPFLRSKISATDPDPDVQRVVSSGTTIVKGLLNAQTLIKIVSECFHSSRSHTLTFHPINVYDHFLRLIRSIGPLFRGVLAEEAGQLPYVPQSWSDETGSAEASSPGSKVASSAIRTQLLDLLHETRSSSSPDDVEGGKDGTQDKSGPRFQNYEILTNLLQSFIPSTFPLLQAVGKALLPKREPGGAQDAFVRTLQIGLAEALAESVLDHLRPSVAAPNPTSKEFHYWGTMLHVIERLLIEDAHPRHPDRATVQIIAPVLFAFKERGGLDVMNSMLGIFQQHVLQGSGTSEKQGTKPAIAALSLKKILDLYQVLANGKHITDTASSFNLQRHTDKHQTVPNVLSQLVVEIRATILPAVASLWESGIVEKTSEETAKRLLDVMKLISKAENEPNTTPKDKSPFHLLRYSETRFSWTAARHLVDQLLPRFDRDLVHEAVFRANGNNTAAEEYCQAHAANIAGPRNPIPAADANTAAASEPHETGSAAAPEGSDVSSSDDDRMSLDEDGFFQEGSHVSGAPATGASNQPAGTSTAVDGTPNVVVSSVPEPSDFVATKESLDKQREGLRKDLIDRCLDVIRTHPGTAIEVSELINNMVIRLKNPDMQEDVCSTLTFALSSLALEEEEKKKNGQCISSYAHLLALLLQDRDFFLHCKGTLRDHVDEYIELVKISVPGTQEETPPWIPYLLLILEILLREDETPVAVQWKPPKSLEEPVADPVIQLPDPLITTAQREVLLESVLESLPRVGKEGVLAMSTLRVLVILTRNRSLARRVGDKKNLQRLFLMAKQLAGSGTERLKQSAITNHIMTILRHIVEDEDVMRQIIRTEIRAEFPTTNRGPRRTADVATLLRHTAPLALRAPSIYVDVVNEELKFERWSPSTDEHPAPSVISLKTSSNDQPQGTEQAGSPASADVKASTEPSDKPVTELPKTQQDAKRPLVENPDGIVHFLLSELVNYREVDDKEANPNNSSNQDTELEDLDKDASAEGLDELTTRDKKPTKPVFKSEEHPIFVYRCFLLSCLTELLQSYTRTKVEFINFKRSAPPLSSNTPVKPRTSVLNYLIYDLLCQSNLSGTAETLASKKKAATAAHTQRVLVALISRTKERPVDRSQSKYSFDDDADLLFVRKHVLDTVLKAYEKAPTSDDPLETRYSRMQSLAELMGQMMGDRDREGGASARQSDTLQGRSQAQLRRLMYEKGFIEKLTSSIAEINLNFPGVKRAIKYVLRVLRTLTDTAKDLSQSDLLASGPGADIVEDDIASSSSLSELEDEREETPDLYRNSSLGMLEPRGEDDESDDEDDEGEEYYGDEYDDEMDYDEEGMSEDDQDNISEDSEMGQIEGLPGNPGVVEVIMDDDEDEEDDSDDEDDEDEDELDSDDMEDVENRVEIVNEDGEPIDDDENSDWESDPEEHEVEAMAADDLDYEAAAQDDDEIDMHGMPPPAGLLDDMAHALMEGMEGDMYDPDMMADHYPDDDLDDEEDDEADDVIDDDDDDENPYDEDYPLDDQPPPMPMPALGSLGWDGLNPDIERQAERHAAGLGPRRRPRMPFHSHDHQVIVGAGPMLGGPGDPIDFRSYWNRHHHHRPTGNQPALEDGVNPLLRRQTQQQESNARPGHSHAFRIPDDFLAGMSRHEGPMGLIGELMDILPPGRDGRFRFTVSNLGGGQGIVDRGMLPPRASRHDHRRESSTTEPNQAVSFSIQSTLDRWGAEARLLFGNEMTNASLRLSAEISAMLTPAAVEQEKKLKEEEAEKRRRAEEERRAKEEEERRAREQKEREGREAREKKEAEEREAAERAAAEAAARGTAATGTTSQANTAEPGAMEGVEATQAESQPRSEASGAGKPRVMAVIGNQEIDVTDLGIDPDYLAALPEEFREEVIAQTVSARRSQAREEAPTGESPAAFQEFLDALPPTLRREIEQQEAQEQRRRGNNGNARASLAGGARDIAAADMEPADILLTLPPELRNQVLLEQDADILAQLPPDVAAQARRLQGERGQPEGDQGAPRMTVTRGGPVSSRAGQRTQPPVVNENKEQRRAVVQMLDKAGVATLVRLMFITQQGSVRSYLFSVFADVCENRQNRLEVVSTVLGILQEGSVDMHAVDRSFSQLSLKAKRNKDKDTDQKTPQSLKRTLTGLNFSLSTPTNSETSPLLVVQQCLELLVDLTSKNPHVPWLFLTEHEIVGSTLKRALNKKSKGKDKESKAHKFAINSLLTLLDRELIMESSVVMTHLADLLNRVTLPLQALERRRKEAEEQAQQKEKAATEAAEQATPQEGANEQQRQPTAEAETQAEEPNTSKESQPEGAASGVDQGAKQEDADAIPKKRSRQIQPPLIPPQYLTLVVRIFVARECSSKTFQNTISTIKNLSTVPGAKAVFGQELVSQARLLSKNIVADLGELLPHIEKAATGTEIQGLALAKFSPGASEQNKLLRVLTALDHLFDGKKKNGGNDKDEKQDLLSTLHHNSSFSEMWEKLGTCLTAIHERENMFNVATILLPLIESLMVVCKNTTAAEDQSQTDGGKDILMTSPPPESRTANLFFSFTDRHRRILNELVRNNPKLMSGTFALLVKNPKVLEFDNKRNYFNRSVHSRTGQPQQGRPNFPTMHLSVRRDQVFHDSFRSLYFKNGDEMKYGKINVKFHGEEGVDAGGVTREWFQVLTRQMFDPNYVLFIPVSSDRTTFHPNKSSGINDEHLMFFKFIGRIIGKALYEGRVLDCFFSRAVYKRILGKSVSVKDMESFDPDYYKSLCWMLENDITDIITETFSVEDDEFGVTTVADLIPNGRDTPVTEENKHDYVRLVVEHKLLSSVKDQMENFLKGFHDIIPRELIAIFNEQELELLISGLPEIDVDDWKSNTEYQNYTPSSPQIQWFWRALRSFDKEERAKLLQFVTGTSKVPLNGFKELEGMNGVNRFNIHRDYGNKDRLPTSHTCFNQLDLPEYESYESLRTQLYKAITQGSEYFGFA